MLVFYYTSVCWMLAFYSNYHEVKTMRSPRVPAEEQYRLIMECTQRGLSDHQWCLNNDINPGTFYNWVSRLRKSNSVDIPDKNPVSAYVPTDQEVVKIEMNSLSASNAIDKSTDVSVMELVTGNTGLRIPNGTDPMLLAKTIRILTELSC